MYYAQVNPTEKVNRVFEDKFFEFRQGALALTIVAQGSRVEAAAVYPGTFGVAGGNEKIEPSTRFDYEKVRSRL